MKHDKHVTLRASAAFDVLAEGATARAPVEMQYDTRDPFAIAVVLSDGYGGQLRWSTARDLLADGLIMPAGEGNVQVRPAHDKRASVLIEVNVDGEWTVFRALTAELADFLDRTYDVVAAGTEAQWMDLDAELGRLLSADSPDSD